MLWYVNEASRRRNPMELDVLSWVIPFQQFTSRRLLRETALISNNLVDPASSHMLVSKIKPCMSQCKLSNSETANGSLKQL